MKKLFILLMFVVFVSPTNGFASGAVAGATEPTQLLNKIILGVQQGIQTASKVANIAMKVKQVVTDPMTALFGSNAGKQIENETRRWLMSGFEGNPLIVQNPEAYVKNSYTNALRNEIAKLEMQRTPATQGIIISLIKQRRAELTKAPAEVKSNVPSIIQKDLCENGGIERLVENEVGGAIQLSGEGNNADRVTELYNELCLADPNTKEGAEKLLAVETSGSYFTWDAFLARTGGDNEFANSAKTIQEVARRAAEKGSLAAEKSKSGYLPDEKCIETVPLKDDDGNPMPGVEPQCVASEVLKPGDTVADLAKQLDVNQLIKPLFTATKETNLASDALSGITDVFKGLQEAVGVVRQVGQIGQQIGQIRGSIDALTGQMSYLGGLGDGSNPNTPYVNLIGTTYTNYSSVGQSAFVNRGGVATSSQARDNSTPEEREAVAGPAKNAIQEHQTAMTKAQGLIGQIDSYTNQYKGFLDGITSCTQNIRGSQGYEPAMDDARISNFTSRASAKRSNILAPITNQTTAVKTKISTTNTFLANAITAISNSQNISFILSTFQDYRDAISRGIILPPEVSDTLEMILTQSIPPLQKEMNGEADSITGAEPVKAILDECEQYLQEVNARGFGGQSGQGG